VTIPVSRLAARPCNYCSITVICWRCVVVGSEISFRISSQQASILIMPSTVVAAARSSFESVPPNTSINEPKAVSQLCNRYGALLRLSTLSLFKGALHPNFNKIVKRELIMEVQRLEDIFSIVLRIGAMSVLYSVSGPNDVNWRIAVVTVDEGTCVAWLTASWRFFKPGMSNWGSPEGHMGHICVVMRATHDN